MGDDAERTRYNLKSPSVKRLMQESKELRQATEQYHAQPLEDNLYEWHFTIRGAQDTEFADGIYHGRIMLPAEYPMKPPSIVLLTPNGRFEVNKKICLSISGHHPESWQPSWSIRTALMAIIGFLPSPGKGAIGALDYPPEERKKLAKRSKEWKCPTCGVENHTLLQDWSMTSSSNAAHEEMLQEVKDLARKISFKGISTPETGGNEGAVAAGSESVSKRLSEATMADARKTTDHASSADEEKSTATPPSSTATTDDPTLNPSTDEPLTPPPAPPTSAFADDTVAANSSVSPTVTNAENHLRQRIVRGDRPDVPVGGQMRNGVAAAAGFHSSSSFYLMVLLSVAICVLLLRRIFRQIEFNFDFHFSLERH